MNIKMLTKTVGKLAKQNAPTILVATGLGGCLTATIMAVKATPKAERALSKAWVEKDGGMLGGDNPDLTFGEKAKVLAPIYAPAALVGLASAGMIIAANKIHLHRKAMLIAAYELSESALKEWQAKTAEKVDEKTLQEIKQAVVEEDIRKNPPEELPGRFPEGYGAKRRCRDCTTGTTFYASLDEIDAARNDINDIIVNDGEACLNDFFDFVNADHCDLGNVFKWVSDKCGGHGRISHIEKIYTTLPNGDPLLNLRFCPEPDYDFRDY